MHDKSYPARVLAASSRTMAWQHRAALPLDALPSWTFEETLAEGASVAVCRRSRTLAVYRVTPGDGWSRLKRRPQALDRRLRDTGQPWPRLLLDARLGLRTQRRTPDDDADYMGEIAGRLLAGV